MLLLAILQSFYQHHHSGGQRYWCWWVMVYSMFVCVCLPQIPHKYETWIRIYSIEMWFRSIESQTFTHCILTYSYDLPLFGFRRYFTITLYTLFPIVCWYMCVNWCDVDDVKHWSDCCCIEIPHCVFVCGSVYIRTDLLSPSITEHTFGEWANCNFVYPLYTYKLFEWWCWW